MKTINSKLLTLSLAALAMSTLGSSALAASTWDLISCTTCVGTGGAASVAVTAYGVGNSSGAIYSSSVINMYSGGLGVSSGGDSGSPNHAIDNNAFTDALLLNFGTQKVDLDFVKIGWKSGDADISVFRYTGGSATPTPAGLTTAGLAGAGWTLVGNYANLAEDTNRAVNTTDSASSWWLLSAYSSAFGTTTSDGTGQTGTGTLGIGNDYFKLSAITGTITTKVPEPGSLMLLGLGLVGLVASRRRSA